MNRMSRGIALILGLVMSGSAMAGGAFIGRAGLTVGKYNFEDKATDQGCCGNPIGTSFTSEYDTNQYGVLGGLGLSAGRFFADVGLEYLKYQDDQDTDFDGVEDTSFYRTDGLLTLGFFIGDRWTAFGGYRKSTVGDGFFSEDLGYTVDGPFIGGGVSFRPGKTVSLGASAAYNFLDYSEQGTPFDSIDFKGFSIKLQASFLGTPHAIFLRFQRFEGDESEPGSYDYETTEDYVNLGYQATFDFTSW